MRNPIVKLVIQVLLSIALTLLTPYLKKQSIGKLKPVVEAWSNVKTAIDRATLDDEVTIDETNTIMDRVETAVSKTISLIKGQ